MPREQLPEVWGNCVTGTCLDLHCWCRGSGTDLSLGDKVMLSCTCDLSRSHLLRFDCWCIHWMQNSYTLDQYAIYALFLPRLLTKLLSHFHQLLFFHESLLLCLWKWKSLVSFSHRQLEYDCNLCNYWDLFWFSTNTWTLSSIYKGRTAL